MKKISLALLFFTFCIYLNAQQNTFPTIGNVGIGTTSPTEKLTVNGALKVEQGSTLKGEVKMPDLPLITGSVGLGVNQSVNQYKFLVIGEDGVIRRGEGTPFEFPTPPRGCTNLLQDELNPRWFSGRNKLYVACPQVNVGINTENPRTKLDVQGNTITQRLFIGNDLPDNNSPNYFFLKSNMIASVNAAIFSIQNSENKILEINNNGLILAREMKLNQTWADYVFEKQYPLMPLNEVEQFILNNKHLPNVPSAKEVEENGITVNETNKLLLEKVEELTLYLIEQDKKIKVLEQQIDVLIKK